METTAGAVDGSPFPADGTLAVGPLVDEVLRRNPTVAQMVAAYEAASQRYGQVTALDDPMFGASGAPSSLGSPDVDVAYRVELSQKIPFPGKRRLRGAMALAEASASAQDIENARIELREAATRAFYEYYLVGRALAVNRENARLLEEFRENARSRYGAGQAPQQDLTQADVELGRQGERQLGLERMRRVALARINTLMHLAPDTPLPPPPTELESAPALPEGGAAPLIELALARRPDLVSLSNRIEAEQAALALALKEYRPDVEVMGAYDAYWQAPEDDLRTQVGMRVNLPKRGRRRAAVAEARAKIAEKSAEFSRRMDEVRMEVTEAYEMARESEGAIRLYTERILPAAEENVKAAQSAYVAGQIPFMTLVEAERNLIELRDRSYEATAGYFKRRAALERALAGAIPAE